MQTLDILILNKLVPFPGRFPAGVHFERDFRRFIGKAPTTVIDAGANVGQTALRFSRFFPEATIYSFEPVKDTFRQLVERCASSRNIECIHAALGEGAAEILISLNANSELNSLLDEVDCQAPDTGDHERVSVQRLDEFARERGIECIDLLKMDTEGYEIHVLRGAARMLADGAVRAVFAECGFLHGDKRKVHFADLDLHLSSNGFRFSGLYQAYRWGSAKQWVAFANGLWLHVDGH
jgi:FkbM family methyltransferase